MYVAMFCDNCGKRFINPCIDDCAHLCEACRAKTALDNEINDRFTEEEIKRIMKGPASDLVSPEARDAVDNDEDDIEDDYFEDDSTFEDDSDQFDLQGDLDADLVDSDDE